MDRKRFKETLDELRSLDQNNSQPLFLWNGLEKEPLDIAAVYVNGLGVLDFPLKANDASNLIDRYPLRKSISISENTACCEIKASHLKLITKTGGLTEVKSLQDVTYCTLQKMLDISFEHLNFNIEARLNKLILCGNGESYSDGFSSVIEPGKFGILMLQVPLVDEQQPGRIVIHNGSRESVADFGSNSSYLVAAAVGFSSCQSRGRFTVNSDPLGVTAVMVFHLLWNDCTTLRLNNIVPPHHFPKFLMLTNEIKMVLMPWLLREPVVSSASTKEDHNLEQTKFLCISIFGLKKPELALQNWIDKDLIVVKSLRSITFLDVHGASICPKMGVIRHYDENRCLQREEKRFSTSAFYFTNGVKLSPIGIHDDLFKQAIDYSTNVINDLPSWRLQEGLAAPVEVIVIRPRNLRHVLVHGTDGKLATELFLESLQSRLGCFPEESVAGNPFLFRSLLSELEQIVDCLKAGVRAAACERCFFAYLSDACIRLKAETLALEILTDVLKHWKMKQLFICMCKTWPRCRIEPTVAFANFVCFTNGWERDPETMHFLSTQLVSLGNLGLISRITLTLLQNGYLIGARETFKRITPAVTNSCLKPLDIRTTFDVHLVTLGIRMQDDDPDQDIIDILLDQMTSLQPFQLTELIVHLGESLKQESLNCYFFMKELGNIIIGMGFNDFTPLQFLRVTETYKSIHEQEMVETFWKSLCTNCIQILQLNEERSCLLCATLRENKSTESRSGMIADLLSVEEFNEALNSSLAKLKRRPQVLDAFGLFEYLNFVVLVEEPLQLTKAKVVEHFSELFSLVDPCILGSLASSLFNAKFDIIHKKTSIERTIFESLLKLIAMPDLSSIVTMDLKSITLMFAWFGDVELVKLFTAKLNIAVSLSTTATTTTKTSIVLDVLTAKSGDCNAASSVFFSRDVFHCLMLECLEELETLPVRTSYIAISFELLATCERSFKSSFPIEAWTRLMGTLSFLEAVAVVKTVFEREINTKEPVLKGIPSSWMAFRVLCYSALSKWTPTVNVTGLTHGHLVSLTQSMFWIGEQNGIADVCRLLNEIQCSVVEFSNIQGTVIEHKRSIELATSSLHSVLAFNELIDIRIRILSRCLTFPRNFQNCQPSRNGNICYAPYFQANNRSHTSCNVDPCPNIAQRGNADVQNEMERLLEIRKHCFTLTTLTGWAT